MRVPVWIASLVVCVYVFGPSVGSADEKPIAPHQRLQGTVVEKGGSLAVKVPNGTTYQLNENRALRHGHEMPKVGDQVTVVIDENNMVLEVHPPNTQGAHRFVTGEVVSIGVLQREIKLKTSEGERTFPLEKTEMPSSIRNGAQVKAEVNEAGSVIDLHPAQ
jgi:hypothetical protein